MTAILPRDELDGTTDCPTHGSAYITFGGKFMLCPDCAAAELTAIRTAAREAVTILRKIGNDEFCDNDGRGCGSGWRANEAADKLAARLGD